MAFLDIIFVGELIMSSLRSSIFLVILCCSNGIVFGIMNSSYASEGSDTVEIAPIPPNLLTEISIGRNGIATELNVMVNDGQEKDVFDGLVFKCGFHLKFKM